MKLLLSLIFWFTLTSPSKAADITISWLPNTDAPWEKVRIYELITAGTPPITTYKLITEVDGSLSSVIVHGIIPGPHSYVARSFITPWESDDSNIATTPIKPSTPHITLTVTVSVQ